LTCETDDSYLWSTYEAAASIGWAGASRARDAGEWAWAGVARPV